MKNIIRVNFYSTSISESAKQRIENTIREIYWKEGGPDNWAQFDGEIKITQLQDRGGDFVEIRVDSEDNWASWLYNAFLKNKDIRSLTIKMTDENKRNVLKKALYQADYNIGDWIACGTLDLKSFN